VFDGPLDEASDAQKAGWLGTWLGSTGREIFKTLTFTNDADKKKPNVIVAKLEDYVRPRKNKRVARHRLRKRKLLPGESFDMFMKDLSLYWTVNFMMQMILWLM
jgi:hypothetical protein